MASTVGFLGSKFGGAIRRGLHSDGASDRSRSILAQNPLLNALFHRAFAPPVAAKSPILAQARRSSSSVAKDDLLASPSDLQFKAPLEIIKYPDPILRAKNKRVNSFDDNLKSLVDEMFDVMYRTDGMGLSAPQVGVNIHLMVFNPAGEAGEGEEIVLVNPHIKRYSRKIVPFTEGCLSFPGIYADVERPDSLKVDAQDIKGARFEINLTGLSARVFQHEYDHLQGVLFFDRMSDAVLDTIRADLQFYRHWKRNTRKGLVWRARRRLKQEKQERRLWDLGNHDLS